MLQPLRRLTFAALVRERYMAPSLIAGAYEMPAARRLRNSFHNSLGVFAQCPFIEGPALPRPTYWPPLRRSAPGRHSTDPSADRTVDQSAASSSAAASPTPNAQAADQSARPLIPSERELVTALMRSRSVEA